VEGVRSRLSGCDRSRDAPMVGSRLVRNVGAGLVPSARSTRERGARGTPSGVRAEEMTRAVERIAEAGRCRECSGSRIAWECEPECTETKVLVVEKESCGLQSRSKRTGAAAATAPTRSERASLASTAPRRG
jgi:hypothetical protein